jgi:hypothetical protein
MVWLCRQHGIPSEDIKVWSNLLEMTANMVLTMLDTDVQHLRMAQRFKPAVFGSCVQAYFPVMESVRPILFNQGPLHS